MSSMSAADAIRTEIVITFRLLLITSVRKVHKSPQAVIASLGNRREVRADRVGDLAQLLVLPLAALSGEDDVVLVCAGRAALAEQASVRPFRDPDPFHELSFATPLAAKRAIANEIRLPLGRLSDDDRQFIDALVARTLSRPEVIAAVHRPREALDHAYRGDALLRSCRQPIDAGFFETAHHGSSIT